MPQTHGRSRMTKTETPEDDRPDAPMADAIESGTLDTGELDRLLGFRLRLATVVIQQDFNQVMSELALTQMQSAVLMLVQRHPAVSQVALAAALNTDRATMMGVVDRLEARELLQRRRSTEDRRRQELHLTRKGGLMLKKAREVIARHEQKFWAQFGDDERQLLFNMLERITHP